MRELLGSTAKMSFHMLAETGDINNPAAGVTVMKDEKGTPIPIQDRVELSGDRLSDARVGFDPNTHEPLVTFRFDSAGAARFAEITRENVGKPFAIVLDNKVLSAPVIREPITGGSGQISGSFTRRKRYDACGPAARRRVACQADRHRRAHRRRRPRRPTRSAWAFIPASSASSSSRPSSSFSTEHGASWRTWLC